jgi:hypothetical protein
MPIGTIIGVNTRGGVKKGTGEVWSSTNLHYTYSVKEKGMVGIGADNVRVDLEKFEIDKPEIGSKWLIEKDGNGFLENIEFISPPAPAK